MAHSAGFTPFCFSIVGMLGTEAYLFLYHLADHLCTKWERAIQCGDWLGLIKIVVLRATMLCVCGSQARWRSLEIVDDVSITESD